MGLLVSLIVGLIAGAVAGQFVQGRGFGLVGEGASPGIGLHGPLEVVRVSGGHGNHLLRIEHDEIR